MGIIDGKGGNDKIAGLPVTTNRMVEMEKTLTGGTGNDDLTGGKVADSFQCGAGIDKITDFKPTEWDKKTNDCVQF